MGSKKLENRTNSLLPNFKWKLKTEKLKGSYPIQLINKLRNIHINIIHQISSSQGLHTSQHPYKQETRKIDV